MLGNAIPKQTSGMWTANDSACICRACSRCCCSTGDRAAAHARAWDISRRALFQRPQTSASSVAHATVDRQRGARDERAVVAGEEQNGARDLLRRGVAAERDALLEKLGGALRGRAGDVDFDRVLDAVVDRAWVDAVDADAARR